MSRSTAAGYPEVGQPKEGRRALKIASLIVIAFLISRCLSQVVLPNDAATTACQTLAASRPSPTDPLQTPSLLYSVTALSCSADVLSGKYGGANQLACDVSADNTYTRFVVSIPSRSNDSLVTSLVQNVTFLGQENSFSGAVSGSFCLVDQNDCVSTPCSPIVPITLKLASSPIRVAYNLIPLQPTVPFSFLPVDLFGPNATSNCAAYFAQVAALPGMFGTYASIVDIGDVSSCSYNGGVITARFGDALNLTASCGLYSDPTSGLSADQECQIACVMTRPDNTTSEHRRWLAGPIFKVYRVQSRIQWNAVMAVAVTIGTTERTIFIPTANASTVMLSDDRLVRVSVSSNYLTRLASDPRFAVDGYVFTADYGTPNMGSSINQGIFNPYLDLSVLIAQARLAAMGDPWLLLQASQVFIPRIGLTPAQLGSGKVPTYNSTGSISWFYIPTRLARTKTNIYTQTQDQLLGRVTDLAANGTVELCNAGSLAACRLGIPGWQLNSTGGADTLSLCQLSNGVNAYANQYRTNLAAGGNVTNSVPAGPLPVGLFPAFDISAPNVWINQGQILIDPGQSYDITAVFSLAIDVANQLLTYTDAPTGVVLTSPEQSCLTRNAHGTGELMLQLTNVNELGNGPIMLTLNASCVITEATNISYPVTVYYNSSSPTAAVIIPAQQSVTSGVFQLNFTAGDNGTVSCTVQGNYPASYGLPPLIWDFTCAVVGPLQPDGGSATQAQGTDDWGAGAIAVICVIGTLLVAVLLSVLIAICVKAGK